MLGVARGGRARGRSRTEPSPAESCLAVPVPVSRAGTCGQAIAAVCAWQRSGRSRLPSASRAVRGSRSCCAASPRCPGSSELAAPT